jgi:phytoene dehydrogenase-like protein
VKLIKLIADLRYSNGGDESYHDWVSKRISHKKVFDLADSFCRWALSVDADEVSSREVLAITKREVLAITKNLDRFGAAGVPIGGCKSVSDGLAKALYSSGGEIEYQTAVEGIVTRDGRIRGLSTSEDNFDFDAVISNVGPKATLALCKEDEFSSEYIDRVSSLKSANGIKIAFSSDEKFLHSFHPRSRESWRACRADTHRPRPCSKRQTSANVPSKTVWK